MPDVPAPLTVSSSLAEQVSPAEKFHVRPYCTTDVVAINNGFNEIFAQQRSIEEWAWKFQPEHGDCWITVAIDRNDELIAHFGVVRQWVQVFNQVHCAGQAMDVYCLKRPDTADARVFAATVQHFYRSYGWPDKISFLFGFPGTRHLKFGQYRLGYADPIPVPVWRRPAAVKRLWWRRYSVRQECSPQDLDTLWKRSAKRYPVAVVRNGERLTRRYLSRPGHDYVQLTAWKGRRLSAWAVLKQNHDVLEWVDLVWDGEDQNALIAMDDAADKIAELKKAQSLEIWLAQDPEAAQVLERRGWTLGAHSDNLGLTSISFNPDIIESEILRRFYFTKGDSDLV